MSQLKITQKKSFIGYERDQRATIKSLGLRRINHSVIRYDTAIVRGMINKVSHLIIVEELS
jgi:large subunit ribosomal protein L30